MFGEVGAWIYKALGGIKPDPKEPGFKHILLEPHFVEGLDHFRASYKGPHGKIISAWKREGESIHYTVTIPANSRATLLLPKSKEDLGVTTHETKQKHELPAGTYHFTCKN